jgi:ABC-type branched-subunit amino acid transport system ATPase component
MRPVSIVPTMRRPATEPVAAGSVALRCSDVRVTFDGIHALDGVALRLDPGEILGLIGTNGAGKTTLVNVISGYQPTTGGQVLLGDQDITGWAPERLARAGVVRTFQNARPFPALSVLQTVEVAAICGGSSKRQASRTAWELLERAGIARLAGTASSALSHGQVRVLGILRALATAPRFVLVDEPAAGSNEQESDAILRLLEGIVEDFEVGMLVIEHDMSLIMRLCPRIQVLDHGKTIAEGPPAAVRVDPDVIRAYLGTAAEESDAAG